MKILYFGSFDKPYDTEVYVANTLESLGHTVQRETLPNLNPKEGMEKLKETDADFILLSKGWYTGSTDLFNRAIRESKVLTVGWFWDLAWGTAREWQIHNFHAFQAKLVLTSDGGHDKEWEKIKIRHKTLRQGIYEPEAYMAPHDGYKYDVVFVGSNGHAEWFGWKHRDELLTFLREKYGERFYWFGRKDGVRNAELNEVYANAKVVVGDSVYSPNYWSNRLYETIGRGGFLIFPQVPGLSDEFTPGEHFVPYQIGDWEGLKKKIDYYLEHDDEREEIRKAGFEYCKANHTYTHRCKELIKYVNEAR